LATPCTAPFLGAALGFAFVASNGIILLTFLVVGLGLAFPYLLLCWFPAWLKKLPKPGAWMEKFKMLMGFPMLATAIWLFSVALKHFPYGALNLGLFLVMVALAAWIFGEFVQRGSKRRGLAGFISIGLVSVSFMCFLEMQLQWRHPVATTRNIANEPGGIQWQAWSPMAVQEARAKGHAVLVDFTADWCLTCQANKKTSIEIPSVREKIKALNVAPFLADNTLESAEITAEIQKYQRAGVPLVLVLPADANAPAIVLPELLTPNLVLEALEKAVGPKAVAAAK
jgi:thiol:disulfide interchange protein